LKTIKKGLAVLDTFTQEDPNQGVTEIARKLGFHKSTVFAILSALREAGYVLYDTSSRRYFLGFKVVELAGRVLYHKDFKELALPILKACADKIEEDVGLNIMIEGKRVCIALVESRYFVRQLVPLGKALPLHCSAAGKVLMAYLAPSEIDIIITRYGLPAFTDNTITNKKHLLDELRKIRERGYAESREEFGKDAAALAFPVFDGNRRLVASLSIQSTINRLNQTSRQRYVMEGLHAAREISGRVASMSL